MVPQEAHTAIVDVVIHAPLIQLWPVVQAGLQVALTPPDVAVRISMRELLNNTLSVE